MKQYLQKPWVRTAALATLFVLSFCFFLYLTFPYGVLKEALTATISRNSGFIVRIGNLTPNFPIGLDAEDIKIMRQNGRKTLKVHSASVEIGVLSLLIGRLRVDVNVYDGAKGELRFTTVTSLFRMLLQSDPTPSSIYLASKNYPVDGVFDFGLSLIDFGPQYQQFLGTYLEKISFRGQLNGLVEIDLDSSEPTKSEGVIDISLANGSFTIEDPSLGVDPQIFRKFAVKANMKSGAFALDNQTGIESQEIFVGANGKVELRKPFGMSQMNLNVEYKLSGSFQQALGFAIEMVTGGVNGEAKLLVSGPLSQLKTTNL